MIADEAQWLTPIEDSLAMDADKLGFAIQVWLRLIFQYQSVCTQEKEDWHSVMSKEGYEMEWQVEVGIDHHLVEPIHVVLEILVFVFLDDGTKPVAIVVEENADDGKPSQHVAFRTT